MLDYAEQSGAIILSPNYRLLPEANAAELMQDIHDFWAWTTEGNAGKLLDNSGTSNLDIDLTKVLMLGESAGESSKPHRHLYRKLTSDQRWLHRNAIGSELSLSDSRLDCRIPYARH